LGFARAFEALAFSVKVVKRAWFYLFKHIPNFPDVPEKNRRKG
jgi:hypothetical protein